MARLLIIFSFFVLGGCSFNNGSSTSQNFQALSNFKLDSLTPIHNEPIKILYCSSIGNPNAEKEYLIQFIALRVKTKDTINIITDHSDQLGKEDVNQIFLLNRRNLSEFQLNSKIDPSIYQNLKKTGVDLNTMVISDPKFSKLEQNKFKSIVGEITRK